MKKTTFYILVILFSLASPLPLAAQQLPGAAGIENVRAVKNNGLLHIEAEMKTSGLGLGKQQMLTVTPVLRSADRKNRFVFEPVVLTGKIRAKAIRRAEALESTLSAGTPYRSVRFDPKHPETILFQLEAKYEPWMRNAELVFDQQITGCLNALTAESEVRALSPVLPPVYVPTYRIAYAEPPTESVKQRSESYAARLNFAVNRYEIRRDYMNNAAVLDEVDRIIGEVKNDPNLTITRFSVTGYASPEGTAAGNLKLSENRAKAFVEYIRNRHVISPEVLQVDWKGDDWNGLEKLMAASRFADKNRVLDILSGTSDSQRRKNDLRGMGAAYRTLLDEYYPHLRRNEYTIDYVARPFSVEEAKVLVKTKPQHLSLNEMFLVANTYPKESREFKEVFDVAARLYPDSDYARLNSAALDIEHGAYDAALERSLKVNLPEAWNNVGYIYIQRKEYTRAEQYFRKAAEAGLPVAKENLTELNRWMEDPE